MGYLIVCGRGEQRNVIDDDGGECVGQGGVIARTKLLVAQVLTRAFDVCVCVCVVCVCVCVCESVEFVLCSS